MDGVKNRKKKSILIIVFSMLLVLIAGTYAWYSWKSNETAMVLTVGDINRVRVTLSPYQINTSLSPTLSYEGNEYVQVTAVNNKNTDTKISLYYQVNEIDSALIDGDFKYTILKSEDGIVYYEYEEGDFSFAETGENLTILDKEEIGDETTSYYRVYLWIDGSSGDQSSMQGKVFNGELRANISSVGDIVVDLVDGLIPVTIANDGTVTTIASTDSDWYDYDNKEWANAVLVKSNGTQTRSYYQSNVGKTVDEADILAYYVYVPRYSYAFLNANGSPETIQIMFENARSRKLTGNATENNYRTHPAFTFGNDEVNGIWVGKFETAHTSLTTSSMGCTDENCANADGLIIKPNVQSLRSNTVSSFFYASRSMERSGNPYGLTASEVDTHMMKNSEWGAVAYLSHSIYGIDQEIYINNSSGYYTGRSGGNIGQKVATEATYFSDSSLTTYQYSTYGYYTWTGVPLDIDGNEGTVTNDSERTLGAMASTTGNVTGVYDMSGGTWEYVMGVFANADGHLWTGYTDTANSGFNGLYGSSGESNAGEYLGGIDFPLSKYYDKYQATSGITISATTACSGGICYGHALSETSGWYLDNAYFVSSNNSWFLRGAYYNGGSGAGVFYFGSLSGIPLVYGGFRSVLVKLPYRDSVLNGADPELADGMIPVTIANDGTVTSASIYEEWYNYTDKEWANAVLVKENGINSRNYYLNNSNVEIQEDDILAYYVWIPKYSYKMNGTEESISISFNSTPSDYIEHPAFIFKDGQLGIWVGKFEMSQGTENNVTTENPTILPSVAPWTDQNISTQFQTALKFSGGTLSSETVSFAGNSLYGLASSTDSHMMKNSEWGAVAYLSHSIYGINTEILINNYYNNGRKTGCGGIVSEDIIITNECVYEYGNSTEYPQTTTGNVTGIFDMSGGVYENVMGVFANSSGDLWTSGSASNISGFNGLYGSEGVEYSSGIDFPPSKYYDKYQATSGTTISETTACNNGICYGHALSETTGWYDDTTYMVLPQNPWFIRGGYSGSGITNAESGVFSYSRLSGQSQGNLGFRSVLVF